MSHQHLSEEELILYYYGEESDSPAVDRVLQDCPECRSLYGALQRTLNTADSLPIPERGADYGAQVWRRLSGAGLPACPRRLWIVPALWRWAAAGLAFAGLLAAAFFAGRSYAPPRQPVPVAAADPQRERILLVAVGDYLERSQMVLIELANADAKGGLDISAQQERAEDLVSETRLYRQTAAHTGDGAVAGILDELERLLVDITHEPSRISPEQLDKLRERFKSEGILFKIRVLGSNVRREQAPSPTRHRL